MKVLVTEKISEHKFKDNSGYLICTDCVCARTGKQTYTRDECFGDGDDTEIEVDRKEEDVFSEETLASFENKPLTIQHPNVDVNPDNHKELSFGYLRDVHKGTYEGKPVMMGTIVVTDAEAIRLVESGELTNLSCGYDCDVEDVPNPCQKNIRGNHIALCDIPRAGNTHIQDSKDKNVSFETMKDLLDKLSKAVDDNDVDNEKKYLAELENKLPFKNNEEHGKWLDISSSEFWEDFEEFTMNIMNRTKKARDSKKKQDGTRVPKENIVKMLEWWCDGYEKNGWRFLGYDVFRCLAKDKNKALNKVKKDYRNAVRKADKDALKELEEMYRKHVNTIKSATSDDSIAIDLDNCGFEEEEYCYLEDINSETLEDTYLDVEESLIADGVINGGKRMRKDSKNYTKLSLYKVKNEYGEYCVKCYVDDKYSEIDSYYTDDWQDAVDTFNAMAKRLGLTPKNAIRNHYTAIKETTDSCNAKDELRGKRIPRREHDSIIKKAKRDSMNLLQGNDVIEVQYDLDVKAETQKEKAEIIKFLEKNNIPFEENDLYLTIYFFTIEQRQLFYKNLMNGDSEE